MRVLPPFSKLVTFSSVRVETPRGADFIAGCIVNIKRFGIFCNILTFKSSQRYSVVMEGRSKSADPPRKTFYHPPVCLGSSQSAPLKQETEGKSGNPETLKKVGNISQILLKRDVTAHDLHVCYHTPLQYLWGSRLQCRCWWTCLIFSSKS